MSELFHGIWTDLREKRLWPIAAGLVVALVAVPVVLYKGGGDAGSDAGPSAAAAPPKGFDIPTASLADTATSENSDLGVFNPKDPFRPAGGYRSPTSGGDSSGGLALPTPGGAALSGASGGSAGGSASATSGGGSAGTGGSSDSGSSSAPGDGSRTIERTEYEYVVDLRVGERGKTRSRKGVKVLTLLPTRRDPLFVFLGVTPDARRAVFAVHKNLVSQDGEGECKPSKDHCSLVYLRTGDRDDDHSFRTGDGKEIVLHLSKIREVVVERTSKTTVRGARAPKARRDSRFELPRSARRPR